jgi:hypothetical protein
MMIHRVTSTILVVFAAALLTGAVQAQEDGTDLRDVVYKCYIITPASVVFEVVTLVDQFEPEKARVNTSRLLCVPALKFRGQEPPPGVTLPPDLPPHLKCYTLETFGPPVNEQVRLCDQFHSCKQDPNGVLTGGEVVTVGKAPLLCDPVQKIHLQGGGR